MSLPVRIHPIAATALLTLATQVMLPAQSPPDLAGQIAELMGQAKSGQAHQRFIHAKGIVCQGNFAASTDASACSSC